MGSPRADTRGPLPILDGPRNSAQPMVFDRRIWTEFPSSQEARMPHLLVCGLRARSATVRLPAACPVIPPSSGRSTVSELTTQWLACPPESSAGCRASPGPSRGGSPTRELWARPGMEAVRLHVQVENEAIFHSRARGSVT